MEMKSVPICLRYFLKWLAVGVLLSCAGIHCLVLMVLSYDLHGGVPCGELCAFVYCSMVWYGMVRVVWYDIFLIG